MRGKWGAIVYWTYDKQTRVWKRTIGEWKATVLHVIDSSSWYGSIDRTGSHHERYKSPDFESAQEGRVWCEIEIDKRLIGLA